MAFNITAMQTYSMNGIKEEFADWVANISPEYTPFTSMISKFPVKNTIFHWQTDELNAPDLANAVEQGSDAGNAAMQATTTKLNYTQIMRKVVMVSDTANSVSSHGREKELFYQLRKAAKELKRDQEAIFLSDQAGVAAASGTAGKTSAVGALVDASMVVAGKADFSDFEAKLFETTSKLYSEGAEPTIIMYNPDSAEAIAGLQEKSGVRERIFENDKRFVKHVEVIVDPLGQEFKCVPNRWMPAQTLYILNPSDFAQATLRAPQQVKLAKVGSAEKYMIEQEVGLRLRHPKAAAILTVKA